MFLIHIIFNKISLDKMMSKPAQQLVVFFCLENKQTNKQKTEDVIMSPLFNSLISECTKLHTLDDSQTVLI